MQWKNCHCVSTDVSEKAQFLFMLCLLHLCYCAATGSSLGMGFDVEMDHLSFKCGSFLVKFFRLLHRRWTSQMSYYLKWPHLLNSAFWNKSESSLPSIIFTFVVVMPVWEHSIDTLNGFRCRQHKLPPKKPLLGKRSVKAYYIIAHYSTVSESISEENNRQKSETLIHVERKKMNQ